ncbi:MAG: 5-oxoprolinase subunit PxpB [Thiobacillus sp.]
MPDYRNAPRASSPALLPRISWRWVTERGLRVETGEQTLARYQALTRAAFDEVATLIPADGSLLIVLHHGASPSSKLLALLAADLPAVVDAPGSMHELLVDYGGAAGRDLAAVAEAAGLSAAEAIALHSAATYRVQFMGFQPGFAYLAGTPTALHQPRLSRPRTQIPAGSLAIGGSYTGIYPAAGPGGWNLIGRVEARLFDPRREPPALLMPGDQVRFIPL